MPENKNILSKSSQSVYRELILRKRNLIVSDFNDLERLKSFTLSAIESEIKSEKESIEKLAETEFENKEIHCVIGLRLAQCAAKRTDWTAVEGIGRAGNLPQGCPRSVFFFLWCDDNRDLLSDPARRSA